MTDREQLHQLLNERFPRFAQHLPFDQRDAIVQLIQSGPLAQLAAGSTGAPNPAEVPPTTFEQIENAALDFARDLDASTDSASGKMAREKFRAVWRSAQPHD